LDDPSVTVFRVKAYGSSSSRKACISLSACITKYKEHKKYIFATVETPNFVHFIRLLSVMRSEVLREYLRNVRVFWVVTLYSMVVNRYFVGAPCLLFHSSTSTMLVFLLQPEN
jgi:hypothetical protein